MKCVLCQSLIDNPPLSIWFGNDVGLDVQVSVGLSEMFSQEGIDDVQFLREWMDGMESEQEKMDELFRIAQSVKMNEGFALRILWELERYGNEGDDDLIAEQDEVPGDAGRVPNQHGEGMTNIKRGW